MLDHANRANRGTLLTYDDLPILEQIKWDQKAWSNFENDKIPSWYQPEFVNTLYFPTGGNPFLVDCADIVVRYYSGSINE